MNNKFSKWLRKNYNSVTGSIAFFPGIISIAFLVLSVLMLEFDFSEAGKHLKSQLSWLSLRDASTARSIISTIAGGIISLTVFSFSMVMILLNQAASQMSNRMIDSMIGNRFQQIILGCYIGSIVYSLFLLSTIRDISSGIYVPALSVYLLLLLTIVDIILFIYFLHYVTQSVKFDTIIKRIHHQTLQALESSYIAVQPKVFEQASALYRQTLQMPESGYLQDYDKKAIVHFAADREMSIEFLHPIGTFLLQGTPFICIHYDIKKLTGDEIKELMLTIDFYNGQPIDKNPYYGFHQLAEVAIKALSPGINDPETAVFSIYALGDLFRFRLYNFLPVVIADENEVDRLIIRDWSFEELFEECYFPIWDYGKTDRYIQNAMKQMLEQLKLCDRERQFASLFDRFENRVKQQIAINVF